ncbi:MAG: TVP38/TMEM64 family protein [Thermodesulfobacteriota bacterium]
MLFLLLYISPLQKYLGDIQGIKKWLISLGWKGPAVWMGIVFIMIAGGTPRLLLCPIGGLAFGFWQGLLWTQLSTLASYYALFLFVRWGGRDFILRRWSKVGRLNGYFQGHSSTLLVFTVRQIPMSGFIINLLLGLSPIRHPHFLLGSALGILPEAIPFTLVTSSTLQINSPYTPLYIAIAIGFLFLVYGGLQYFYRHSKLPPQLRRESLTGDK